MQNPLGSLTTVDLRNVWPKESGSFTPWLAREENLELLGDALGFELELVNTEVPVGPYWADILARDTGTGRNVIIENQLEKTNHDHLGKLLTYGAILDAAVVVWIAQEFSDEHRKTLDWLNDHTDENLEFFGVCIELWRIGDSQPAPRFNVLSRPADVLKQARSWGSKEELSETQRLQLDFWTALRESLQQSKAVPSLQTPRPQYWYEIALGRSNTHLACRANLIRHRLSVRVYLGHQIAKPALEQLEAERDAIQRELGMKLEWNPFPDKRDKIIGVAKEGDLTQREKWPEYLEWMTRTVIAMRKVFQPRIKALALPGAEPEEVDMDSGHEEPEA